MGAKQAVRIDPPSRRVGLRFRLSNVRGKLAREGHQVVQFKDVETNKFVAVAVDGEVKEYGTHRSGRK